MFSLNSNVIDTQEPPIAEAISWLKPERFGPDMPLIDVCQAVPGYPPVEALREHLSQAALDGANAFYTDIEGIPALRQALATDVTSFYGGAVTADDVLITAGCNQAFMLSIMSLCEAGNSVLIPTPWYFNHKMTLDILDVKAIELPCLPANAMVPDVSQAEALLQDHTRAIVLVTPNNPTGAIYSPRVINDFLDLAKRKGLALIVDETYRDFLPADMEKPHDLFATPDWREGGFVHLYSFSKVFAMTGYRTGAIIAKPSFISQVAKVMDCMAICAPSLGQVAAGYGLANLTDWRAQKRQLMDDRIKAFRDAMGKTNSGYKIRSIGAYFAYVEHPYNDLDSMTVAKMLAEDKNFLCLPGSMFGNGQDKLLRFAFANVDAEQMPDIVARLSS
jgi:aspartate/methionine/tyrosine aminotransferase